MVKTVRQQPYWGLAAVAALIWCGPPSVFVCVMLDGLFLSDSVSIERLGFT